MSNDFGPPLHRHKFLTLDALRGVAAIIVLISHSAGLFGHPLFAHSYLSVDFFFMLSGFVLSYAYQDRLDDGLSVVSFMKARIIRLYPLYLAGTLAGFVYSSVTFLHTHAPGISNFFVQLFASFIMLPMPQPVTGNTGPWVEAFPYNIFAWSLFYELLANLVHAAMLRRRSTHTLWMAASVAGGALFVWIAKQGSAVFGVRTVDMPFAMLRVAFSYLVGILIFRFWNSHRDRRPVTPYWALGLLLLAVSLPSIQHHNAIVDIVVLLVIMPAVMIAGAFSRPSSLLRPVASLLGLLSYGIYILSMPLLLYTQRAWQYIFRHPASTATPWSGFATVASIVAIAWLANVLYDIPLRRWLTRSLEDRRPIPFPVNSRPYLP